MTQLARGLGVSLVLVAVAGVVVLVVLVLYARSLRRRGTPPDVVLRKTSGLALAIVMLAIAAVTLVPTSYAGEQRALNLVPGHGLAWPWESSISTGNILGNLVLFLPLGILLPLRFAKLDGAGRLLVMVAAASVAIELLQYGLNLGRAADVNDILINVLGAAIGRLLFGAVRARYGSPPRRTVRFTHHRVPTVDPR